MVTLTLLSAAIFRPEARFAVKAGNSNIYVTRERAVRGRERNGGGENGNNYVTLPGKMATSDC